jgi:hypothetical protein
MNLGRNFAPFSLCFLEYNIQMKKILHKLRLENLKKSLMMVSKRMPISVALILATTFLFLYRIYTDILSTEAERIVDKAILTLVVTFIFSVGIYLFHEAGSFSKQMRGVFQLDSVILAIIFYYFFDENLFNQSETLVYIMVTMAGVISFAFIAPFILTWLNRKQDQQRFIDHTSLLTWKGVLSGIVGVLMMWLGFAALAALFALFDIDSWLDSDKTFVTWAVLSLSLVAPLFLLINIPQVKDIVTWSKNKFHTFVVNYLGLPAIIIYFLILYAYTVKVLINFTDWPQGKIAWLVIGFSIFGYLIYFALESFREKYKAARVFQKISSLCPVSTLPRSS